jgi:hypothetical protein
MTGKVLTLVRELLSQHLEIPLERITDETEVPDPEGLMIVVNHRIGESFKIPPDVSPLKPITLGKLIEFNKP